MNIKHYMNFVIYSLLLWGIQIAPAYAYLDPGTGSLLIQGLLGGIAGATVFIRIYWNKITAWFKPGKPEQGENENRDH